MATVPSPISTRPVPKPGSRARSSSTCCVPKYGCLAAPSLRPWPKAMQGTPPTSSAGAPASTKLKTALHGRTRRGHAREAGKRQAPSTRTGWCGVTHAQSATSTSSAQPAWHFVCTTHTTVAAAPQGPATRSPLQRPSTRTSVPSASCAREAPSMHRTAGLLYEAMLSNGAVQRLPAAGSSALSTLPLLGVGAGRLLKMSSATSCSRWKSSPPYTCTPGSLKLLHCCAQCAQRRECR
mmetsp:Transcript_66872/g.185186  ORF Transcript_66872/g.185186 Transcript_66872/m.185186 type:complete len:237 (-) Transcript_66872:765-1475(-)